MEEPYGFIFIEEPLNDLERNDFIASIESTKKAWVKQVNDKGYLKQKTKLTEIIKLPVGKPGDKPDVFNT